VTTVPVHTRPSSAVTSTVHRSAQREGRTILETLKAILTAVCGVSDTPVSMGLVMIGPFKRLTVETGSQGRTARELLTDAMTVERLKTSWLLFYDPRLEQYFFSVYPVRVPQAQSKEG